MSARYPPKFAPGGGYQTNAAYPPNFVPSSGNQTSGASASVPSTATGTNIVPPQLPSSPWEERFDPKDISFNFGDGQHHSLYAPIHPRLDPMYYHDLPRPRPLDMPDEKSLDNLFTSENIQKQKLFGLRSWQAGALNTIDPDPEGYSEYMAHLPYRGGHSASYDYAENYQKFESQLFTIDENKWFDIWQKNNWFDLEVRPRFNETKPHISKWTVQDPRIWNELRIIIEFSQRVLDLLIKERNEWLDTLLFGEMVQTDGTPIPISERQEPDEYCLQARPLHQLPARGAAYEAIARQRFTELTRFVNCSFTDEADFEECGGLTPAEANLQRFDAAITHAICNQRRFDRWDLPSPSRQEPYHGDGQLGEMGISLEQHLFGGPGATFTELAPNLYKGAAYRWKALTVTFDSEEGLGAIRVYEKAPRDAIDQSILYQSGNIEYNWHTPAFFPALLFTDQYWTDVVGKKGRHALKPPFASFAPLYRHPEASKWTFFAAQVAEKKPAVDELRAPLQKVREALHYRIQHMAQLRPWFSDEHALWQKSLWSWSVMRINIEIFRSFHARRDFRECADTVCTIASIAQHYVERGQDPTYMTERQSYRVYWLLYLLMAASLPTMELQAEHHQTKREHYSQALMDWQQITSRTVFHMNTKQLKDAGLPDADGIMPTHPTGYLQVAADQLFPLGRMSTIAPRSWIMALVNCYQDLMRQRQKPGAENEWADFNFEIPTYSRDAAYLSVNRSVASLDAAGLKLTPNNWPPPENDFPRQGVQSSPKMGFKEPQPKNPEMHFSMNDVANRNWIIIPSSNAVPEVWDPTGISVGENGQYGSDWETQLRVLDTWHCGKVLKFDGGDVELFRKTIRSQAWRRMGTLLTWYIESELLEFDGTLSRDVYKTDGSWIYNITGFLSDATTTAEEARLVMAQDDQIPGYLVNQDIQDDNIWRKLLVYRVGGLRPEFPVNLTEEVDNPLLLTWNQLRLHDNPDTGVYIAIDNIIYDITQYQEHHPAPFKTLVWLAGRDATAEFYQVHPGGIESLNIHNVQHTIRRVGRVVDEFDELSGVPADCFVLHDYMFRAGFAEFQRGYGGQDMTPSLSGGHTPNSLDLAGHYLERGKNAIAKRSPPLEQSAMISKAQLAQHNDANSLLGAWVATYESDKVYDVTSVIRWPNYFDDVPLDLESCAGGHIQGAAEWLRANLLHRTQGWMQ
ncbi:hypothetical protein PG984_013159 [Apiospora sp. TS-2023a]